MGKNKFTYKYFQGYIWDIPNEQNKIYLTFDDGPTPKMIGVQLLKIWRYSYFCIGKTHKTILNI
jgi:hypothetical protein